MKPVHDAPMRGKGTAPSSAAPEPIPLRWDDPAERCRWLTDLRDQIADAVALGDDATRRPRKRFFARAEARRRLHVVERALASLLLAAERGLDASPREEAG
jgi:hypothetical protein